MSDQGVRYVVTLSDVNVSSGLRDMEGRAVRTEQSIDSLNGTLRSMAGALGVGFGLHEIVNFGKEAIQGAADYEIAVMRIMNVSKTASEGLANVSFINAEVDKLKIPLQEAADAYGNFLVKIANSGLAGEQVRKLHDEILSIAKITGSPQGKMDAAVLDIGKMLAEGVLEARTLRQLERVFPQITPFIADKMGLKEGHDAFRKVIGAADDDEAVTALQKLSRLESSGKLTKLGINSKVLLDAIDAYYSSIKEKIPGALNTIQSNINDLSNDWLRFKNSLVDSNRPELQELFAGLKDGIGWLKDNEGAIISVGGALLTIGKYWLEYKIAMFAATGIQTLVTGGIVAQGTAITAQTTATAGLNAQLILLNENLELLIANQIRVGETAIVMSEAEIAGFSGALGLSMRNMPVNGMAPGNMKGIAGNIGNSVGGIANGVMNVFMVGMAAQILASLIPNDPLTGKGWDLSRLAKAGVLGSTDQIELGQSLLSIFGLDINSKIEDGIRDKRLSQVQTPLTPAGMLSNIMTGQAFGISNGAITKTGADKASKIAAPNDKVTGQRVVTYNITIKEINGIKQNTVQEGGKMDTQNVAMELRDIIASILNDSQIRAAD